mmetsp:Transcript_18823/g.23098  ORF Transcript_18823/g.23098 Transcript_18823/m.23098 type:complete len:405 (-) Transcript_18823:29-1243(-)
MKICSLSLLLTLHGVCSFQGQTTTTLSHGRFTSSSISQKYHHERYIYGRKNLHNNKIGFELKMAPSNKDEMSVDELKTDLSAYLKKREELNANEKAKSEVGKVIGGTKGNIVLEYVSGAPNKPQVIDEVPDIFDYTELAKYGYSYLSTPIMKAGGRREMYSLMGLPEPAISNRIKKPKKFRKVVIDRDGATDQARYSGLKVSQLLDDDEMGKRLAEVQDKVKKGEALRKNLVEEKYVMPFADKRNTGPQQTPDWTPEMLDEEGRRIGKAMSWAKKARAGEFLKDPYELIIIEGTTQLYSIVTTLVAAFAFGRSSQKFLVDLLHFSSDDAQALIDSLQLPAFAFVVTSLGSCIVCAAILAPSKNRSSFVWGVKGFAGGPLEVLQLKSLDTLITRGEAEESSNNKL